VPEPRVDAAHGVGDVAATRARAAFLLNRNYARKALKNPLIARFYPGDSGRSVRLVKIRD
jgi:hypothetical protein